MTTICWEAVNVCIRDAKLPKDRWLRMMNLLESEGNMHGDHPLLNAVCTTCFGGFSDDVV